MAMRQGMDLTTRRALMKGIGGAIVASAAPGILRAEDKAGTRPMVLGTGAHRYEVALDWAKLPHGKRFGNTHSVCEDGEGRIYIHNQGPDSVCVFDDAGRFIKSWGREYERGAHGMQLRKEGSEAFFYLATTSQHTVVKTTLEGEVIFTLEYPREARNASGQPCYTGRDQYNPTNIAFGPNGDFYVADGYGRNYIHQYSLKGAYLRTWGGAGSGEGQLNCPHGLWCDTRGPVPLIVVADRANVRLQYFTLDGRYVRMMKDELRHPCHFDQRGTDLLVPDLFGRVTIFDKDDKLVAHLGDSPGIQSRKGYPNIPREQRVAGKFISPHGAIWDRAGNIFVVEWVPDGRVTKLRRLA